MKKILAICLACTLSAVMLAAPASAHGGRRHGHHGCGGVQTEVTVCPYEECTLPGRHTHDNVIYCGYDHESGCCSGACAALCTVEGCTLAGRHLHDGTIYCGSNHSCGYCNGACVARTCGGRACRR